MPRAFSDSSIQRPHPHAEMFMEDGTARRGVRDLHGAELGHSCLPNRNGAALSPSDNPQKNLPHETDSANRREEKVV